MKYFEIHSLLKGKKAIKVIKAPNKTDAISMAKSKTPGFILNVKETSTPVEDQLENLKNNIMNAITKKSIHNGTDSFTHDDVIHMAPEFLNIVVGHALPHFPNKGIGTTITPPIEKQEMDVLLEARKHASISIYKISTEHGNMFCATVGKEHSVPTHQKIEL